jgi:hypothetical protein
MRIIHTDIKILDLLGECGTIKNLNSIGLLGQSYVISSDNNVWMGYKCDMRDNPSVSNKSVTIDINNETVILTKTNQLLLYAFRTMIDLNTKTLYQCSHEEFLELRKNISYKRKKLILSNS